jgi:hypothetical protein
MKRRLVLNWNEAHAAVKDALDAKVEAPWGLPDSGKGWTYVTFAPPGTAPGDVLFDLDRLEAVAKDLGYHLPTEVVAQHNKLVVVAHGESPSAEVFGLARLLEAYAAKFADTDRHPNHGFFGKVGGQYDRVEKGRVLAVYARGDDPLLTVTEAFEGLVREVRVPGIVFATRLANGLSAVPRLLHGFDDPAYRATGATFHRITDPAGFDTLLAQVRADYGSYRFAPRR